jgi:hypothetical protein
MLEKLRRMAEHPWAPFWVTAAATLLVLPSVTAGLAVDDYLHILVLSGSEAFPGFARHPLDLFRFAHPPTNPALLEDGIFPWWADVEARFAFFRPLSALTHALDHALWPKSPVLMHLHSVAWHLLSLLAVAWAYRRIIPIRWVGVLALALYALDDARGAPVAWVANRNALIGCAISVCALVLHHRTLGTRRFWLAPLVFAVGLLAGEGGISILAYLFAHALFLDSGTVGRRLGRLAPYGVIVLVWALLAKALGYGVSGSGVYFDPIGDPLLFLTHLPERILALLFAQLGGPWSEGWNAYSFTFPPAIPIVVVAGIATLAVTAIALRPLLVRSATARFWALGAILAAVPTCAAFPADRLLPWVGIGAMGVLAEFVGAYADAPEAHFGAAGVRRLARVMTGAIVVVQLIAAPIQLPMRSRGIAEVSMTLGRAFDSVPSDPSITDKIAVYVNPPADPYPSYMPMTREALGIPRPRTQRWLGTGITPLTLERLDDRTLRVTQEGGYLPTASERILRSPRRPFAPGQRIGTSDLTIEIVEVLPDGRPLTAHFHFDRPLEDPSLLWLAWGRFGYEPFALPAVGERRTLPAVNMLEILLGPDNPLAALLER